jgi:hypothetical protein
MRPFTRRFDAAQVEVRLRDFGRRDDDNPIRDEIARLRDRRNAGELSETDFATRVSELVRVVAPVVRTERCEWGESLWTARDLISLAR